MKDVCKRLIEVDFPIRRISAHARREKSIRHGHISTLHIWWARRPLAACRAVICAALWPDPADPNCPEAFRKAARDLMRKWAVEFIGFLSAESKKYFVEYQTEPALLNDNEILRRALLDFIADFGDWDNSTVKEFLETSRALTQAAHEALGGQPRTRPLVADPFAGGGSIPLEALRVGANAFASDLNPVAVLLNKVVLEYIPKHGRRLAEEVRKCGDWIKREAAKELAEFYPKDPDGSTPITYLWARTVKCEGPGCGADVPLMRSLWLAKRANRSVALKLVSRPLAKRVDFEIIEDAKTADVGGGTVARGSATCPCCGFTTPVASVRRQLRERRGGTADARLFCVVTAKPQHGRCYRTATERDGKIVAAAVVRLSEAVKATINGLSAIPDEEIPFTEIRRVSVPLYGMTNWGRLFNPRQALTLVTLTRLISDFKQRVPADLIRPLTVCLGVVLGRQADFQSSLVTWTAGGEFVGHTFTRQALGMVWDFAECNPWADASGNWDGAVDWVSRVIESTGDGVNTPGGATQASATASPLPDASCDAYVTDPPYYDAVPYAHLADYFYVWLRRAVGPQLPELFSSIAVPKAEEIVVDRPHALSDSRKDVTVYERELTRAFSEGVRILRPSGIGLVVFASKTTASWEAILQALLNGGWVVTGSWPIDSEREARLAAQGQSRLGSSVHIICRPREGDQVGDWRDVLQELPRRMHKWMPNLVKEGVVGADAIFACLGPALEIFSRYGRVEKPSGEQVTLREYLEHVWAAVSKEALAMIFAGADATGFEEDARLTAMWFWTLSTGMTDKSVEQEYSDSEDVDDQGEGGRKSNQSGGYVLEYDAARKIAQGLGGHLEQLGTVVEVRGDKARLLSVFERRKYLLGKPAVDQPSPGRKKKSSQKLLFETSPEAASGSSASTGDDLGHGDTAKPGATVLDRVHQSMLLFGGGRSEALKRFLVEDGVGRDQHFWRLAQALSALYPSGTEEKRWVDGVLARKKGLGF